MPTENASVIWCASYSAVRCMSPQTTTPVLSLPENKKCEQLLNATVGTIKRETSHVSLVPCAVQCIAPWIDDVS
jgi:hypothetical protein